MIGYVTGDTLHFLLLVVVGAALLLLHWDVSRKLWKTPELAPAVRLIAPLPPFTPIVAFVAGRPVAGVAWIAVTVFYCVVRFGR